jgi:hypothetical protein
MEHPIKNPWGHFRHTPQRQSFPATFQAFNLSLTLILKLLKMEHLNPETLENGAS